jgi:hypothetical protein
MGSNTRFASRAARLLLGMLTPAVLLGVEEAGGAQLTASWVDNSAGTATTRIERRVATDPAFAALADVPPGVATYVDASVSPGTTYCYRALAYDAIGVSPYSEEACATSNYDGYSLAVSVSKAGTGDGTVVSTPAGINCGTACSATFLSSNSVTLDATTTSGSTFTGWSGGGCSGTAPCTLAGNATVTVTASFSPAFYALTVAKSGPGSVTSAPAGISCGSDCSESFANGTMVTLTANPNNGSTFMGWTGGGCSGASLTCTVSVRSATSVSAAFNKTGKGK